MSAWPIFLLWLFHLWRWITRVAALLLPATTKVHEKTIARLIRVLEIQAWTKSKRPLSLWWIQRIFCSKAETDNLLLVYWGMPFICIITNCCCSSGARLSFRDLALSPFKRSKILLSILRLRKVGIFKKNVVWRSFIFLLADEKRGKAFLKSAFKWSVLNLRWS